VNMMDDNNLATIFGGMVDILSNSMTESAKTDMCRLLISNYPYIFESIDVLGVSNTPSAKEGPTGIQIYNMQGTFSARICKPDDTAGNVLKFIIEKMQRTNPDMNFKTCHLYGIKDRQWRRINDDEYIVPINEKGFCILIANEIEPELINNVEVKKLTSRDKPDVPDVKISKPEKELEIKIKKSNNTPDDGSNENTSELGSEVDDKDDSQKEKSPRKESKMSPRKKETTRKKDNTRKKGISPRDDNRSKEKSPRKEKDTHKEISPRKDKDNTRKENSPLKKDRQKINSPRHDDTDISPPRKHDYQFKEKKDKPLDNTNVDTKVEEKENKDAIPHKEENPPKENSPRKEEVSTSIEGEKMQTENNTQTVENTQKRGTLS